MSIRNALSLALLTTALLTGCDKPQAPSEEETAKLIEPVAKVQLGDEAPAGGAAIAGNRGGEQIVTTACAACHATGTLGAPKIGDAAAWAPRIGQGLESLVKSAAAGKGQMPPRGGMADLTDDELARSVAFMANKSGAKFEAPAVKAAETPAQTAAADTAAAPAGAADGKKVFDGACTACHSTGVAGAPKIGDKAAWGPRIAKGADTLHQHAIGGFNNVMPPKGGNAALSDNEVKAAVDYMVAQSK